MTLCYREGQLVVEVADDGVGASGAFAASGGHGLIGMRERATIYGGELEVFSPEDGGFSVRARLPLSSAEVAR